MNADNSLPKAEAINHPAHYGGADSPFEAIKVIRAWQLGFATGNAVKYICRAGRKPGESAVKDLQKAIWYLQDEVKALRRPVVPEPMETAEGQEAQGTEPEPIETVIVKVIATAPEPVAPMIEAEAPSPLPVLEETPAAPVVVIASPSSSPAPAPSSPTPDPNWQKGDASLCGDCHQNPRMGRGPRCGVCHGAIMRRARAEKLAEKAAQSTTAPIAAPAPTPTPAGATAPAQARPAVRPPAPTTATTVTPPAPPVAPAIGPDFAMAPLIKLPSVYDRLAPTRKRTELDMVRARGFGNRIAAEQGWFHVAFLPDPPYEPSLGICTDALLPDDAEFVETCYRQGRAWYSREAEDRGENVMIGRTQVNVTTPGAMLPPRPTATLSAAPVPISGSVPAPTPKDGELEPAE